MELTTSRGALGVARARARKWLRIFQQLVRVLDRLELQTTPLAKALVFQIQRALGHLEGNGASLPVRPLEASSSSEEEASGDELRAAVGLARRSEMRRDSRDDPSGDEIEVLLVLAGALTESDDGGSFGDKTITVDQLLREYRALKQMSHTEVVRVELFPMAFRRRWAALLQAAAAKDDPLRRLSFELSIMKVITALWALAVGWRRAAEFGRPDPEGDAWFASNLGETLLKGRCR